MKARLEPISYQYYKDVTIVNDDSIVINKFGTSLTDNARVIIYDCIIKIFTIVNDDSIIVDKFGTSLTDDARVIIYDCIIMILQL